jgi:ectonucleotide pyrophosphatase/phosphodiesterase family protein 1/3
MESTEESETEQPFLPTVVEIANDKSSSKRDFSLFPKIRRACWMQFFLCLCVVLVLFFVGFGVGFLAGHKGSTSESTSDQKCPSENPPLVIVSLDGFRSDYFNRGLTPYLCSLASSGVRAKFLQSQFPTKTFPNHYSIVTGLYPESHGIVHNRFYDPILNDTFSIGGNSSDDPRWWNEGEPIWVTAKKQQVKTATFFWPGSDVEIRKMRPDYWHRYNSSVPWSDRVKAVLEWLDLPDSKRPSFIAMYVEEPDHTGHTSGPQSQEVN